MFLIISDNSSTGTTAVLLNFCSGSGKRSTLNVRRMLFSTMMSASISILICFYQYLLKRWFCLVL